ncbi:MAG: ADP-ribosylation factor-like protein [Candidatus Heimdallarchaeaceae archaeon]
MSNTGSSTLLSFDRKGVPLVIIGLPSAGKTTFVKRLKTGKFQETKPTLGMQYESKEIGDVKFDIFDLGGHISYRRTIWIDSADQDSFEEAKEEFWNSIQLKEDQDEFVILFLCNKSDLKESVDLEDIIEKMELYKLVDKENASFQFFKTSMKTGENVEVALKWLKNNTEKIVVKRKINPLMFMLTSIEGIPIIELDKMGIKEDPALFSGFLAALESYSQFLFGKKGLLQYMISGGYKYIIKTDSKFIYSLIIPKEESQEEARRILEQISYVVSDLKELELVESIIFQILNVDPSDFILNHGEFY